MNVQAAPNRGDRGSVLVMVLVVAVVFGMVVAGLATYATTTLKYGHVVEDSADRLAAANAAMDNALENLARNSSPCDWAEVEDSPTPVQFTLPFSVNGIQPQMTCRIIGGGANGVDTFAAVFTGYGASCSDLLLMGDGANSVSRILYGRVYQSRATSSIGGFKGNFLVRNGDVWYSNEPCPDTDATSVPTCDTETKPINDPSLNWDMANLAVESGYGARCLDQSAQELFLNRKPAPALDMTERGTAPTDTDGDGCTEWEPGYYHQLPTLQDHNYFRSGSYYFDAGTWNINDRKTVLMGHFPGVDLKDPSDKCAGAWALDAGGGAVLYLGGNAKVVLDETGNKATRLEISGRSVDGYVVAVQALDAGDGGTPSSVVSDGGALAAGSAEVLFTVTDKNDLVINGLTWAPRSTLFLKSKNDGVTELRGGVVIARAVLDSIPPSEGSPLLSVAGNTNENEMVFTATAEKGGGVTSVQTRLIFDGVNNYEILSRRILGLTPE